MKINTTGQSLVEIIIATALFAIIAGSLTTMYLGSFLTLSASQNRLQAGDLASEALEAVRSIAQDDFSALNLESSAVELRGNAWSLSGEGTIERIDNFNRYVTFTEVYRDASQNLDLDNSPGTTLDEDTIVVKAVVSWDERGQPLRVELDTLVSNYRTASSTP